MDVFELRDQLVDAYRKYAMSFMGFRDPRIRDTVSEALDDGKLWPHPSVGLNPSFEPGRSVRELVDDGILDPWVEPIFRLDKDEKDAIGRKLPLYLHQEQAIRVAAADRNYVLTTGTGSGKSLAYIIPIVDHVLRTGSGGGVKAIIVYPMNALVNSQLEELEKFLGHGPWKQPPVTFARYTGQDDDAARKAVQDNPPDILLTNYVMLEYILTRYVDRRLVRAFGHLRFLVLDELHSYRGRQGADVALLVRRLREASGSSNVRCVGTSATLSTEGGYESRKQRLSEVSSRLFGAPVDPSDIIGETLQRITPDRDIADEGFVTELTEAVRLRRPPETLKGFVADPLSCWIESKFGIRYEGDRLVRAVPLPVQGSGGGAEQLSNVTGLDETKCGEAIREYLLAGNRVKGPDSRNPVFPFRLHQFISRGDTVYASPEPPEVRELSLTGERFVPSSEQKRVLLPLVFCRECGQDYYMAHLQSTNHGGRLIRRDINDNEERGQLAPGFLYVSDERPWPEDPDEEKERLPPEWFDPRSGRLRNYRRDQRPRPLRIAPDGSRDDFKGILGWWTPAPFRFCLACGISHSTTRSNDFVRLSTLGAGGRASATTVLSLSAVQYLRGSVGLDANARKMLSFTDNRQDASLQAGHLNDFVEVTMLRSALSRAIAASPEGLSHDELPQRVFEELDLPRSSYAREPDVRGHARQMVDATMREVLAYRLYSDLKRGWRITQPNLEQVGLLEIDYRSLAELANDQDMWDDCHPPMANCAPDRREHILKVLLDSIRRELALRVKVLDSYEQEPLRLRARDRLTGSWSLEDEEKLEQSTKVVTQPKSGKEGRRWHRVGARGLFGRFLRRRDVLGHHPLAETDEIIQAILERLRRYGLLTEVSGRKNGPEAWQIPASALMWKAGDGTRPYRDHLRVTRASKDPATNAYFLKLYRSVGASLVGIEAREHTAQVSNKKRMEREERFRQAELPILYCSPTMELGVDISKLNVVNMRNVPPTPANYAQRSGRAGRGGQPALVFTYCSSGNSHDQHFFRAPEKMTAGQVEAPRIDLLNEDLLRAHVHALWLAESGLDLKKSMTDILDMGDENGGKPTLKPHIQDAFAKAQYRARTRLRALAVLADLEPDLKSQVWWSEEWVDRVITAIPARFEKALQRWKTLYMAAVAQFRQQNRIAVSPNRSASDQKTARRLRNEAERQLDVLRAEADHSGQSDFYTYRYFASEGFLPGYSFPRLPLSAFIPGRVGQNEMAEYVQRPRFLAISEFGPQTYIYHEGARYQITRVILSRETDTAQQENASLTEQVKRCGDCGYMHPPDLDVCEQCSAELPPVWTGLLRMRNVSTRRRERITSDEERRRRVGYELISGVRFAPREGRRSVTRTTVVGADTGSSLLELSYGDTATIWRVNLGWRNRKDWEDRGFYLDIERGEWRGRDKEDSPVDSATVQKVVPYVWDARNALVVRPVEPLGSEEMASLEAALKAAIQLVFQLEPRELATEPLPTRNERGWLLLYESAEGGAGALRRLVEEPALWRKVARAGLRLCHQNPDREYEQGDDGGCGGACYGCLLTYQNQLDHELLDRAKVLPFLRRLLAADLSLPEHAGKLEAESSLEAEWLSHLEEGGYTMPGRHHIHFPNARTEPDYLYDEACAAIYVDGPHHDYPDRAARDRHQEEAMLDEGYRTIRFGHRDDWEGIIRENQDVFGAGHVGSERVS